ncbi:unnamed protein product, partial [Rotaria sp. Silwood2]
MHNVPRIKVDCPNILIPLIAQLVRSVPGGTTRQRRPPTPLEQGRGGVQAVPGQLPTSQLAQ